MALWMEPGSEPKTDEEVVDLQAIAAIKQSSAIELKEKGNEYVRKGKKHYQDAIDCYTRAINQKALSDSETSILYSNRAHVNLLLENHRRSLQDAEEAIKLCPTNVKALYRAVKASLLLNLLTEAKSYCEEGLKQSTNNEELKKLAKEIDVKISEGERHRAVVSKAVAAAEEIVSAFKDRQIKYGKVAYQELTGYKKPMLDKNNILHWPVLLLYTEVMSSDIIEDFCEIDTFSVHLDMMFSESSPHLPWDTENAYTRDAVELYYEANSVVRLSKKDILGYLLEGTAGSHLNYDAEEIDFDDDRSYSRDNVPKWVRVNKRKTLHDVLKNPDLIVPGIPVFYVVSKRSSNYENIKSGNWVRPRVS